jgi:hypothetical protein
MFIVFFNLFLFALPAACLNTTSAVYVIMTVVLLISLILLSTTLKIRRSVFLSGFIFPGLDTAILESEFVKAFRKFVNPVLSLNESEFLITFRWRSW